MRLSVYLLCLAGVCAVPQIASAQVPPAPAAPTAPIGPLPLRRGTKFRVKIDSSPQQAAIYIDGKQYGIQGYTPMTMRLPKGPYHVFVELPGFKPVERDVVVTRSQAFVFTLERAPRPAVIDVRSTPGESATGGQLLVDGAPAGTVPGRFEVPAGKHAIDVQKPEFKPFHDSVDVQEGETRTLVVGLEAELKKGVLLVTADVQGAEVYVDGTRRDAAPTMIPDLPEGEHTIEVRKDPLPPFRQVVRVLANQQVKVEARFADKMVGSVRVVSGTPGGEVFIDGEDKGPVNVEIPNVRPGTHIVELRAKGFQPQAIELPVTAGEQRVAKLDLQPGGGMQPGMGGDVARLRVVTPVPDCEVFVDGASMGRAPIDRRDLAPGKHYVVVRRPGYAEWKREVDLQGGQTVALTAELSSSGQLKVLANVPGADVFIDGQPVGRTPLVVPDVPAGEHLIEVRKPGFHDARQPLRIEGGEQKILSADLVPFRTGPSEADVARHQRAASSFSAVTLDPGRFTFDLGAGFLPFAQLRLTVGALSYHRGALHLGLDAGVELRTDGYLTEGGIHAKLQVLKAGPVAIGTQIYLGGGGGGGGRNNFTFEWGIPISLLFGDIVRVTVNPYLQVATDRLCPAVQESGEAGVCTTGYGLQTKAGVVTDSRHYSGGDAGQNVRDRFQSTRLILQAAIEVAVHRVATLFLIFEGVPTGARAAYTGDATGYSPDFAWHDDPQVYGRIGMTFKF
jgi:hypothetical protein